MKMGSRTNTIAIHRPHTPFTTRLSALSSRETNGGRSTKGKQHFKQVFNKASSSARKEPNESARPHMYKYRRIQQTLSTSRSFTLMEASYAPYLSCLGQAVTEGSSASATQSVNGVGIVTIDITPPGQHRRTSPSSTVISSGSDSQCSPGSPEKIELGSSQHFGRGVVRLALPDDSLQVHVGSTQAGFHPSTLDLDYPLLADSAFGADGVIENPVPASMGIVSQTVDNARFVLPPQAHGPAHEQQQLDQLSQTLWLQERDDERLLQLARLREQQVIRQMNSELVQLQHKDFRDKPQPLAPISRKRAASHAENQQPVAQRRRRKTGDFQSGSSRSRNSLLVKGHQYVEVVGGVQPIQRCPSHILSPSSSARTQSSTRASLQSYLDSLLSSRGYVTSKISSLELGYQTKPSPLQLASFGSVLCASIKKGGGPALNTLLQCGLSPNPANKFLDRYV